MKPLEKSINIINRVFRYSIHGIRFIGRNNIYFNGKNHIGKMSCIQAWVEYPMNSGKKTGFNPFLYIDNNVYIGNFCQISCLNRIEIKENVTIGDNTFICDNFHGNGSKGEINIEPLERKLISKGPIIIEKNVLIGRNVCIFGNVKVGEGSIIGANSVVTHDVPPYTVVAGNPAKVIREII